MKIKTVKYGYKALTFEPDYDAVFEKEYEADTAKECMEMIRRDRDNNDVSKYTPIGIVDVED